jgi:hypothetical protein
LPRGFHFFGHHGHKKGKGPLSRHAGAGRALATLIPSPTCSRSAPSTDLMEVFVPRDRKRFEASLVHMAVADLLFMALAAHSSDPAIQHEEHQPSGRDASCSGHVAVVSTALIAVINGTVPALSPYSFFSAAFQRGVSASQIDSSDRPSSGCHSISS